MARVKWLQGDLDEGLHWLDRALAINPNYAQSHYNRGLIQVLNGVPSEGADGSRMALKLSPLDPLAYAMFSTQAMSAMLRDDFDEGVRLAERANQEPGVHYFIPIIAAALNELAGNSATARRWAARAKQMRADAGAELFFKSFPFRGEAIQDNLRKSFARLDLD